MFLSLSAFFARSFLINMTRISSHREIPVKSALTRHPPTTLTTFLPSSHTRLTRINDSNVLFSSLGCDSTCEAYTRSRLSRTRRRAGKTTTSRVENRVFLACKMELRWSRPVHSTTPAAFSHREKQDFAIIYSHSVSVYFYQQQNEKLS